MTTIEPPVVPPPPPPPPPLTNNKFKSTTIYGLYKNLDYEDESVLSDAYFQRNVKVDGLLTVSDISCSTFNSSLYAKTIDVSNNYAKITDLNFKANLLDVSLNYVKLIDLSNNYGTISNLNLKADLLDVSLNYVKLIDLSNNFAKSVDVSNNYLKIADVSNNYAKIVDVSNYYATIADVSNNYFKIIDVSNNYAKIIDVSNNFALIVNNLNLKADILDVSNNYAKTTYVTTQINNLIGGQPSTFYDTLKEIADYIISDVSLCTSMVNSIATKANIIDVSNNYATITNLNLKANSADVITTTSMNLKANIADVSANFALISNLNLKANIADVSANFALITNLNLKANTIDVSNNYGTITNLNLKANTIDLSNNYATINSMTTADNLKLSLTGGTVTGLVNYNTTVANIPRCASTVTGALIDDTQLCNVASVRMLINSNKSSLLAASNTWSVFQSFDVLPRCSGNPTLDNELVNKLYITNNFATTTSLNNYVLNPSGDSYVLTTALNTSLNSYVLKPSGDSYVLTTALNTALGLKANITDVTNLINTMYANFSLTGGGNIKWDIATAKLSWSSRIISIPVTKTSYATSGYFDINMPTNTTITQYDGNSGTTTQTITTDGIQLNPWNALYYKLPIGAPNTTVNANFVIVAFTNSTWVLDSTYVLIAVRNGDDNSVKFLPAGIIFSNVATSTYSSTTSQWLDRHFTIPSGSTAVTQLASDNSTYVATTAYVKSLFNSAISLVSGSTAVTQASTNDSTLVATTAYVKSILNNVLSLATDSTVLTPVATDNSDKIATTKFVNRANPVMNPLSLYFDVAGNGGDGLGTRNLKTMTYDPIFANVAGAVNLNMNFVAIQLRAGVTYNGIVSCFGNVPANATITFAMYDATCTLLRNTRTITATAVSTGFYCINLNPTPYTPTTEAIVYIGCYTGGTTGITHFATSAGAASAVNCSSAPTSTAMTGRALWITKPATLPASLSGITKTAHSFNYWYGLY